MKRPLGLVLESIVKAATPSLEEVPPKYRSELESMETLSDEELWKIADSRLPTEHQRKLASLLRKSDGELKEREQKKLARLRDDTDRLILRKSYAYLLLKYRGHRIPLEREIG